MPGRMHDARVFRNSPLFNATTNPEIIPNNMHLIGDSAYPLLRTLMTPFRDSGHLTRSQIAYNTKLSSIRSIIERSFDLLKTKFRRLKFLDMSDFELGNAMIAAACVLHNFIIVNGGLNILDEDYIHDADTEIHQENIRNEEVLQAVEKRGEIAGLF